MKTYSSSVTTRVMPATTRVSGWRSSTQLKARSYWPMIQLKALLSAQVPGAAGGLRAVVQQPRAQHRHQGERHRGGDDDGHGERDGELMEQPADDLPHEQQRNQSRDQRHRERDDGEADLLRALERCGQRRVAALDVAGDVLDHHDRIVHDEAGRDGERHQRKIVQAVVQEVHRAERADQRQRHREARNDGRRGIT